MFNELCYGCCRRSTWPVSALLRFGAVFLLVALCSWTGIALSRQSEGVATIWLSNGVLFGLLITQPKERWLPYFAAGLVADTAADMIYGDPFRVAVGVSLANSFEVVSSCLLLTLWFGWPLNLAKRRPLVGFLLLSVICATAVTSALGATWTLLFVAAGPWWQMFRTWYLGDMLGMAILAPLIVLLQRPAFFALLERSHLPRTLLVLSVPIAAPLTCDWNRCGRTRWPRPHRSPYCCWMLTTSSSTTIITATSAATNASAASQGYFSRVFPAILEPPPASAARSSL